MDREKAAFDKKGSDDEDHQDQVFKRRLLKTRASCSVIFVAIQLESKSYFDENIILS